MDSTQATEHVTRIAAQAEHRRVPFAAGRAIHWRIFGRGEPLVLVHGGHGSWLHWIRNVEALARTRRLLVPDLPGFGDSDDPPEGSGLQAIVAAFVASLDALLGPGTATDVAGFSLGGVVAALFNGSSLLADCGLLAGRQVALPWAFAPSIVLQSGTSAQGHSSPAEVAWQRDKPWLRDGPVWTSAAPQDTLPVVLDLLAHTPAAELAQAASHVLLFDAPRQLTATATMETPTGAPMGAGSLEQARRWLQDHRNEPYSLQATARAAALRLAQATPRRSPAV